MPTQITTTCACGCGQVFTRRFRNGRLNAYVHGHASRRLRKESVKTLKGRRRDMLIEDAGERCEVCGRSQEEQRAMFGRSLEIHHRNHVHADNAEGNHQVLCTACHNQHSLAVRDEGKKRMTLLARHHQGLVRNAQREKAHCPKGHPYSLENTYVHGGKRHCRTCRRDRPRRA